MKKLFLSVIFALLIIPAFAGATVHDWQIENFESDIEIEDTGYVLVEETIRVDFDTQKHGIFRGIPYEYQNRDDSSFYTEIELVSITRDGSSEMYAEYSDNGYKIFKIGDPDRTITGAHVYRIVYRVKGVLANHDGFDELYWNTTGFWGVPIENASATIRLPGDVDIIQSACFYGAYGSNVPCRGIDAPPGSVGFAVLGTLAPNEGMTVAVGFTPGLIPILKGEAPPSPFTFATLITFVISLILVLSGVLYVLWKHGRDWMFVKPDSVEKKLLPPFAYEAITPEYSPPEDLRPAEIGLLQDETADTVDISATIVHLASMGYLTIEKRETFKILDFALRDYTLTKKKEPDTNLRKYEHMLLSALFKDSSSVKLKDLKNNFYEDLKDIKEELYREGMRKNMFEENPQKVRRKYAIIGTVGLSIGFTLFSLGIGRTQPSLVGLGLSIALGGLIMAIGSHFMSRRTARGRELWRKVRGYELFIEKAEKYRARFYEEKNLFFEVLPYAIVFGLAQKLSDAFEQMEVEPESPSWYIGSGAFEPSAFASDMRGFSSTVSNTMASTPSSSGSGGGGFSGGGFGGGGGGSW